MRAKVNKYDLSGNVDTKIVLISDIHYSGKKEIHHLNKILNIISKLKPNFICIPGDLTDTSDIDDENYLIDWLKELSQISKVIISIGNHEFYVNKKEKSFGLNEKLYNKLSKINNLTVLDNKNIVINGINFIGLTLPIDHYINEQENSTNFNKYIKKIKTTKDTYNVLLCHSPINICKEEFIKNLDIDLVLCGHMHGGAVPMFLRKIFGSKGLVYPNEKLFPKYCYGKKNVLNTTIITTSGIRVISNINKFRMFKDVFASEIVCINIKK